MLAFFWEKMVRISKWDVCQRYFTRLCGIVNRTDGCVGYVGVLKEDVFEFRRSNLEAVCDISVLSNVIQFSRGVRTLCIWSSGSIVSRCSKLWLLKSTSPLSAGLSPRNWHFCLASWYRRYEAMLPRRYHESQFHCSRSPWVSQYNS